MPERTPYVSVPFQDNLITNLIEQPPMFLAVSKMYMSKDQTTALYRWIIGGMIAMVAYFAMKIDNKVDKMYDSYIQQHHIDSHQDNRLSRIEQDVQALQRAQTYVSASRSTTLVN